MKLGQLHYLAAIGCSLLLLRPCLSCLSQLYPDEGSSNTLVSSDIRPQSDSSSGSSSSSVGSSSGTGSSASARSASGGAVSGGGTAKSAVDTVSLASAKSKRICYPDGICFATDQPPYNGLPLPIPPVGMPLRYYLYTPDSSIVEDLPVSGDSLQYMDDRPLKVFIHGFGMNAAHVLVLEMARKLVYKCECNVLVVDWRGGSYGGYTSYVTGENFRRRAAMAFSNSRVAARMLGKFLHRLYEKRDTILPQYGLHCIGVDLGAHICAQLQESFHEPLARISALNPTVPRGCGYACLDANDAGQVDVIHTTRSGAVGNERNSVVSLGDLGSDEAVGHLDFFVNWHLNIQPRCEGDLQVLCSSRRALELYTLSIGESCPYIARSCDKGPASKCAPCTAPQTQCVRAGWTANRSQLIEPAVNKFGGKFFIDTLDESPYCGVDD